jgi:hypothetical protein
MSVGHRLTARAGAIEDCPDELGEPLIGRDHSDSLATSISDQGILDTSRPGAAAGHLGQRDGRTAHISAPVLGLKQQAPQVTCL